MHGGGCGFQSLKPDSQGFAQSRALLRVFLQCFADKGREIQQELSKYFMVDYDDAGSIGKRYRREDEIGTPLCITVDFETVGDENTPADHCVTVRDRDTMEQVRIPISELRSYIEKKLEF